MFGGANQPIAAVDSAADFGSSRKLIGNNEWGVYGARIACLKRLIRMRPALGRDHEICRNSPFSHDLIVSLVLAWNPLIVVFTKSVYFPTIRHCLCYLL